MFINDNYFYHNSRIDNCANCDKADFVARSAGKSSYYLYREDLNGEINIIKEVIEKRGQEISPWIQLDLLENLLTFSSQDISVIDKEYISFFEKTLIFANEKTTLERDKKRVISIRKRFENQVKNI